VQTFSDLRGQSRPATDLPLFDAPATVRTFDSPEFRDITFYEVEAKSVLNRVPAASRMPFEWTVNVYRGCSHACSYCCLGDTPILMADGRTKQIADVRVGDSIYGTEFVGRHRRYVLTQVLDQWSTTKPAYRVRLDDGTELVTSGDHRFLTDCGWKHVAPLKQGRQRPHLMMDSKLLGTGGFATPPLQESDYRRGYLCGVIRGDGHVGSYTYQRPGRAHGNVHRLRLAMTDFEALQRTRTYLGQIDVPTSEFIFQEAVGSRKQLNAIRTSSYGAVSAIMHVINWPHDPSIGWRKGFLAGIFDAEGSYHRRGGILQIASTDHAIIEQTTSCLRVLGFSFAFEERPQVPKPLTIVRLLGGMREHLRFFHTVDPAITRKRSIVGRAIRTYTPMRVASVEPLGFDLPMYDLTTGTGDFVANGTIAHNCFARPSHTYLNFDAGRDFERRIVVKVNAPEVLRRELRRRSWTGAHVAMGTNTDPYQRCEGRYRLTRGVLEALRDYANPCSVLTKSPLLLRDLDLFVELVETAGFSANLSIGTLDEEVWRRTEPGTPHPTARMAAVRQLVAAGVPCGILMAPILPGISDSPEQLRAVVRAAAEAGASHLTPITLHLRPGVKEEFLPWLEEAYPELLADYRRLYQGSNAPKAVREQITGRVRAEKGRHRAFAARADPVTARRLPEPAGQEPEPATQLSLTLG
jgi:DNA repair photolyase